MSEEYERWAATTGLALEQEINGWMQKCRVLETENEHLRKRIAVLDDNVASLQERLDSDPGEPLQAPRLSHTSALDDECHMCYPLACDDPDRHMGVSSEYTPLANKGCRCGADFDGRDCMCFEGD